MNHISPCNHPESYLSGSTIESMIDKTKELELGYFAVTDHGLLTSILKSYNYAKKKDIKLIAGVELFFKDKNCDIIKGTPSESIKYFKLIVHVKDQEAYQKLVLMSSDTTKKNVQVGENYYKLYDWADLKELAKYNVSVCTSNIEGMVSKHLLVDRADLGLKYYEKLRNIFGPENFYPTIIPYVQDKSWNTIIKVTVDGKEVEIPAFDRIETDQYKRAKAIDLTKRNSKHRKLEAVYINKVRHKVDKKYQDIQSAKLVNDFRDLPGGDIQTKANKFIKALAQKFGDNSRIMINNYSYYANKEDKIVQDMKLGDEKRVYQSQFMASFEEVKDYLRYVLELDYSSIQILIENSHRWAKNFDSFKLSYDYRLPTPEGDPQKLLMDTIKKVGRMRWDDPVWVTQFRVEFELLTQNGVKNLIPYFLPIVDVYDFYEKNGHLTGPARGSAGGFLISYLLGITHIDPIKYGLSSSRFITEDRIQQGNLPDIDCDLESRVPLVGKDGNSGYLFSKYGKKAAQISTRTLLRIKSAILDANRFANGGKVEKNIEALSKSLPTTPQGVNDHDFVFGYEDNDGNHVEGLLELNDDLQKYAVDKPKEWNLVKRALSLSRQHSRHACAYVIADTDIENIVPIMEVGGVNRVTQYEAKQVEQAGLMKYDFLVVAALKDINLCLKYINKKNKTPDMKTGYFLHNEKETYIWDLQEDQNVFTMLGEGKTESVFQLNSAGATPTVQKVKPKSIIDCATITSLERPGPKDFRDPKTGKNMVEEYIERKLGRSKGDIPILDEMLPETYGVLVFQEQVTKLAKELANMNVVDSENVRIAVGKKKRKLIDSLKPIFIEGATKKVGVETATKIWDMMETFARYGFNKSHAVAYSVISYACAFLKYHYTLEWWASVLTNADNKEINEVFYKYTKDMVLPPDINTSIEEMSVDYNAGKIRNKLSIITGIGEKAALKIIAGRPYKDIENFVRKNVCGPSMSKKLIHVGVLDSLFDVGDKLINKIRKYDMAVEEIKFEKKIEEYEEKLSNLKGKDWERVFKNKTRYIEKGPKEATPDTNYINIRLKKDFLIKKSIFPTMNLDLQAVLDRDSKIPITIFKGARLTINKWGRDSRILAGEGLQKIDNTNVFDKIYFCVPGYVIEAKEFTYQKGARKALKLIIDSSGYISEKVLWPDYNTGELKYPESLKKGSIVYFFYSKKEDKPYTNITDVIIEEKSILS